MKKRIARAGHYLLGSRTEEYASILKLGIAEGYVLCSVERSVELIAGGCRKLIVLRHDVDRPSPAVQAMGDIESSLNVHSTFYFRWETMDPALMRSLHAQGHEVSYHYETIAEYGALLRIESRDQLNMFEYQARCLDLLADELASFRSITQLPCKTIASHGALLNRKFGVSNATLAAQPDAYRRLGIILETYDPAYLSQFDKYICDARWETNDGYLYGVNPLEAIHRHAPRIIFLSHPNHWAFSNATKVRRAVKVLLHGMTTDKTPFFYSPLLRLRQEQN